MQGLTLEIPDGELMVLVGPSGCGKTTALRMVAGLEEISEGEVRIGDEVVNKLPPRDRDLAMVFQNYALYPHKSIYDNLAFPLRLRKLGKSEIDQRVQRIARVLELEEQLKRKPRQLSGGQRQRVAMGRAIIREPQAFLMDEPLSNLDAKLRTQMRAEISLLHKELGVTTIYVTHDQVEAMTLGQRVAVMRKGELQQVATPQELYDRPVNLFVAGFIGSPSMNFVQGEVARNGAGVDVQIGDQRLTVDDDERALASGLDDWVGRRLIVGIRPEHLEDAALDPAVGTGPAPQRARAAAGAARLGVDRPLPDRRGAGGLSRAASSSRRRSTRRRCSTSSTTSGACGGRRSSAGSASTHSSARTRTPQVAVGRARSASSTPRAAGGSAPSRCRLRA